MAYKCIYIVAQSRSWSASLSSLDHGLQVSVQIRSSAASKCMSKLARSLPWSVSLSSLDLNLQAWLQLLSSTPCSQSRFTVCWWVGLYRYINTSMRIPTQYMSCNNHWTISSSYDFQAHKQRSQKNMLFILDCSTVIERTPRHVTGAPRFVAGASSCSQGCRRHSHLLWKLAGMPS
jgi:hypothetical protein